MYRDIEILETTAKVIISRFLGIPVGRKFEAYVRFRMKDGKKYNINMNAMATFGISFGRNPRQYEELYPKVFEAVYAIVAKAMAQPYINKIRSGATVEVAGLMINATAAKPVKSRKDIVINSSNYREAVISQGYGVTVYNKQGDVLWDSPYFNYKNILLIPHILNEIFA
ncbi:MAG TPA: hypothetical protein PLL17_02065 [Defluviitaleaceae bacterium]|nr:hypothetical protein [Candidatus Epulonipiscium sp.]HOQ17030.1 hypothetical protein [Defluviitaleaceae bacterium]HPT76066.1 hypothetical protein [Defluviitaleaceae bacterium]HQD49905.1 hypothetical protein [Defluviitaleaceae bacterium]